tara:strand:- start:2157 stop:3281 length:1125 start_codon:yes stop_codon:yes gene_type:complete
MKNMRNIPFTDLRSQYLESKNYIDNAIKEVIDTSSFLQGPIVDSFETAIKDYCGAESCASMGSGTVALLCALEAAGVGEGDEVITVSHTWVSTTETICNVGAVPVFVDIDDFYHIDVAGIEHRITDKTKAIVFVDMYGQTTNVDSLKAIANTHNLILIEDAAQSFGSSYNSLISPDVYKTYQVGSIADLTCFSFNPVKNLGAMGDAGAVTGSEKLIDKVKQYRDHGRESKYTYAVVGYNARIDNIQAKIIQAKLPFVDNWIRRRREIAHTYTNELQGIVQTPKEHPNSYHTYHQYVIQTKGRDFLQAHLKEAGIQTNIHYPKPTHISPAFSTYANNFLKKTEKTCDSILSLPVYHTLTHDDQQYIIDSIKAWCK